MRSQDNKHPSAVVGIHMAKDEIRVVEAMPHDGGLRISVAGSIEMPDGYQEKTTGAELKSLLHRIGVKSKNYCLGIPPSYSVTRVVEVPPMPDADVSAVLMGELQLHRTLSDEGGGIDWQRIVGEDGQESCLTMAADSHRLWHLGDSVSEAKVEPQMMPVHAALIRAAAQNLPEGEPTLILSVGSESCEVAIIQDQNLYAYRRLEILGSRLVSSDDGTVEGADSGEDKAETYYGERLTSELSRMIEFIRRLPTAGDHPKIIVTGTNAKFRVLTGFIEESIGAETRFFDPPIVGEGKASSLLKDESSRLKFSAAAAIAWSGLGTGSSGLDAFVLKAPVRKTHRRSIVSGSPIPFIVITFLIAVAGLLIWMGKGKKADSIEAGNEAATAYNETLQLQYEPMEEAREDSVKALAELAGYGTPFPPIMDRISKMLDPSIGVRIIDFEPGGRIKITGEARSEDDIVATVDRMNSSLDFFGTFVDSYSDQQAAGLAYRMTTNFVMTLPEETIE
jgi:Tfp pilus assembly PilM family ATPase